MNNVFTFVLLLVAIVFIAKIIQRYMDTKERGTPDEAVEETFAKISALEERVRVLERIITEHRYDLKKDIENL